MDFNLDMGAAKKAEMQIKIEETGLYFGKIVLARLLVNHNGTTGIEISFRSNEGQECETTLWIINQNKDYISVGYNRWQAIMACLKLRSVTGHQAQAEFYDFEQGKRIKDFCTIYPDVMDKEIGLVLQKDEYVNSKQEIKFKMNIFSCCDAKTKQTATEIFEKKEAKDIDKIVAKIKDKTVNIAAAQPSYNSPTGQRQGAQGKAAPNTQQAHTYFGGAEAKPGSAYAAAKAGGKYNITGQGEVEVFEDDIPF